MKLVYVYVYVTVLFTVRTVNTHIASMYFSDKNSLFMYEIPTYVPFDNDHVRATSDNRPT